MPQPFSVILPDSGKGLLRQEIAVALHSLGVPVKQVDPAVLADEKHDYGLARLTRRERCLLLCINMQGLEQPEKTLALLRRSGGTAAVWFIDNPWNVLAAAKSSVWKDVPIFVTDASFVEPLRQHGAKQVCHLPLAACPVSFGPHEERDTMFPPPKDLAPFVFVGRSAFPNKESFFAGVKVDSTLARKARMLLLEGGRPDLSWWESALGCEPGEFWPGKRARPPALGAENTSLLWRSLCLSQFADCGQELCGAPGNGLPGLDVFGDIGWTGILPDKGRLRSPVDYYARLAGIYRQARYSVCLTSLQLPKGLNQRHFDVWMAGGFCLTDAAGGLDMFPAELTRHVAFTRVQDIASLLQTLEKTPDLREALQAAWRQELLAKHTYVHRMQALFSVLRWM